MATWIARCRFFLFSVFLTFASSAGADPSVTPDGVEIVGATPGGAVALVGAARETIYGWTPTMRVRAASLDAAPDGGGFWSADFAIPDRAVFAVADVATGKIDLAVPEGGALSALSSPMAVLVDDPAGARLALAGSQLQVLVVRPTKGAWWSVVADGGPSDADGTADGILTVALDHLTVLAGDVTAAGALVLDDRVVLLDPDLLTSWESTIDELVSGTTPGGGVDGLVDGLIENATVAGE